MADNMKKHAYRIEVMADGKTFVTWHILANHYFDALELAQNKVTALMNFNCGNMISFEVFSE